MKPDISAPGRYRIEAASAGTVLALSRPDDVVSSGWMELSGTSFSAPMVAGASAELIALHPTWTHDQLKGALMVSAKPTSAAPGQLGVGELNAAQALTVTNPPNPNAVLGIGIPDQLLRTGELQPAGLPQAAACCQPCLG